MLKTKKLTRLHPIQYEMERLYIYIYIYIYIHIYIYYTSVVMVTAVENVHVGPNSSPGRGLLHFK